MVGFLTGLSIVLANLTWHIRSGSTTLPRACRYATADWAAQGQALRLDLRLYAVTDSRQNERMHRSNVEAVSAAMDGGITVVQLREKDADGGDFLREAKAVIEIARPRGVRFAAFPICKCPCCDSGSPLMRAFYYCTPVGSWVMCSVVLM